MPISVWKSIIIFVTKDDRKCIIRYAFTHCGNRTELTVAPGANTFDLTLCRPGDVLGIGKINVGDAAKLYAKIRGNEMI